MRCPSCGRFVSYGESYEPEITADVSIREVSDGIVYGEIAGEVRVVLDCADCGEELKEANIDLSGETEFEHECPLFDESENEISLDGETAGFTSRMQEKDRHGKPITNYRYKRTYYGADLTFDLSCSVCGESFTVEASVEEQASAFEELV